MKLSPLTGKPMKIVVNAERVNTIKIRDVDIAIIDIYYEDEEGNRFTTTESDQVVLDDAYYQYFLQTGEVIGESTPDEPSPKLYTEAQVKKAIDLARLGRVGDSMAFGQAFIETWTKNEILNKL